MMSFISYLLPIIFSLVASKRKGAFPSETAKRHIITMEFDHIEFNDEASCYFYQVSSQCFDHLVIYPYSLRNISDNDATYSVLSTLLVQTPQIEVTSGNESPDGSVGIKILRRYKNEFDEYNERTKSKDKKPKKCEGLGSHKWSYTVYFCLRNLVEIEMTDDGRSYCIVSEQMMTYCGNDLIVPDLSLTISQNTSSPTTASPTTASPTTASPTTASPTTALPTTASPTTASPTTTSTIMPSPNTTIANGTGIIVNRPYNGTGPILISYPDYPADVEVEYDESVIEFVINKECLNMGSLSMDNVTAIILSTYSDCIELFDTEEPYFDLDVDYIQYISLFMNLLCNISAIQQTDVYLNYDELCIEFILYSEFGERDSTVKCDTATFSKDSFEHWGLDYLDTYYNSAKDYTPTYKYPAVPLDDTNHVHLYIIDDGVQADHKEFADGQVINEWSVNTDRKGPCREGGYWCSHGTHVAGIAGGKTSGASKNFRIHDYCVWPDSPDGPRMTTANIYKALKRVKSHLKARRKKNKDSRGVINMSLCERSNWWKRLRYWMLFGSINSLGGIVVVSAGNRYDDAGNYVPANSDLAITVGSYSALSYHTLGARVKWLSSNWGSEVNMWAPGHSIYSAVTSDNKKEYGYKTGTSMAAPHIAGIVANMLYVDKTLDTDDIKNELLVPSATRYIGKTDRVVGGKCGLWAASTCFAPIYECPAVTTEGPESIIPTGDPTRDPTRDPTTKPADAKMDYIQGLDEMELMDYVQRVRSDELTPKGRSGDSLKKTPWSISQHNLYGFAGFVFVFIVNALCLFTYVRCKVSKKKQFYDSEV